MEQKISLLAIVKRHVKHHSLVEECGSLSRSQSQVRLGCFSLKRKCCYPLQQEVPSKHMSVDWLAGHYLLGRLCSLLEKGGIYG